MEHSLALVTQWRSVSGWSGRQGPMWLYLPAWHLGEDAWNADLPWVPLPLHVDLGPP